MPAGAGITSVPLVAPQHCAVASPRTPQVTFSPESMAVNGPGGVSSPTHVNASGTPERFSGSAAGGSGNPTQDGHSGFQHASSPPGRIPHASKRLAAMSLKMPGGEESHQW